MNSMKICFISREIFPFYYGGIGSQIYAQMKYLVKKGHEIYFLTEQPENFYESVFEEKYKNIKVIFVNRNIDAYNIHGSLNYAFNLEKVFDALYQERKPDLVFLTDYAAEGFFIFLQRLEGKYRDIPFLVELQGATYECLKYDAPSTDEFFQKSSPSDRLQSYMENYCIPVADYLVSPSKTTWEQISQRLNLESEYRIIPNSVNSEIFQLRQPLVKKETDVKTIVYAGRLEKRKGVDLLLECFISMMNEHPHIDAELVLLGRDLFWEEYGESFQSYWQQRIPVNIRDKIRFLGHCSQETLKDYLSNSWVAVFPSRWEPFGIVCLEAISLGCPVIVTQDTGLMEIVGTDYGALFNQPKGMEGLKSKLLEVLQNVELRNNLAIQSHLRAKELLLNDGSLSLEYVNLIQKEFRFSRKIPRNAEIFNLYLVFEEYEKLCKDKLGQTQGELERSQSQLQLEGLKAERLWVELSQYKQELERSHSWIQELQTGKDWLESQYHTWKHSAEQTQAELERLHSWIQELQTDKGWLESQYHTSKHKAEETQQELERSQFQLQQAQAKIAEFQLSKLWKLRTWWFQMKKFFGT